MYQTTRLPTPGMSTYIIRGSRKSKLSVLTLPLSYTLAPGATLCSFTGRWASPAAGARIKARASESRRMVVVIATSCPVGLLGTTGAEKHASRDLIQNYTPSWR